MKIKLNNKNIGNIIRFFFSLVPLLFAIWLLINTGSSELIKNTESSANVPIASTISNGDEDEFIATDEFEEFTPYSSENTLKSDSSSETKDKYDNACNGCNVSSTSKEEDSASCISKDGPTTGSLEANSEGNHEILGFDSRQALIILISFAGVIISGYAVRRPLTRKLRIFFILSGTVYFGFYLGGCPCPIIGVFKFFQLTRGDSTALPLALWTAGILYLTYFLGKSWCGWICPIGGIQELVHRPEIFNPARSEKLNKFLRILRIAVVSLLAVYVLLTGVILLNKFDPFKPIFNFFYGGLSIVTIVSVSLIAFTAPLIHRPFCKTICPLGLLMGFTSRIPGAVRVQISDTCRSCYKCQKSCPSGAISITNGKKQITYEDCNFCGNCLEDCGHINVKGKQKCKTVQK